MTNSAPRRGFENKEFEKRLEKIQRIILGLELDGILFSSESEIRYFTGFFTQFWQSPTRPWFAFIPVGKAPIAIIPSIGERLMRDCFVEEVYTWSSPSGNYDGINFLLEIMSKFSRKNSRIGLMMGNETNFRAPLNDIQKILLDMERQRSFIDVTKEIQNLKMIKSSAEVEKIRYVCHLASKAFETLPNWVSVDMPLSEVFRQFKIRALSLGIDEVSYLVGAAGKGGYFDIIAPPTERPIGIGDILMLDTGCAWDGYFCDFDRNFSIGPVSSEAKNAHEILNKAIDQASNSIRPGSTKAKDLFNLMDSILRPNFNDTEIPSGKVGRYGHGLGMQLTEPPSHAEWDETILETGMVLTLEPSITYGKDNFLMVAEENILVLDKGVEFLSQRCGAKLQKII